MIGECQLHGKQVNYLYVKHAGAKLCLECMKAGLFKKELVDEARSVYPEYFKQPAPQERDG